MERESILGWVLLAPMLLVVLGLVGHPTAASFVRVRVGLAERPLLTPVELLADQETKVGGLVVVGSYVPKTTQQLNSLLAKSDIQGLRIDVAKLLEDDQQSAEIARIVKQTQMWLSRGRDVVIYTSRQVITGNYAELSLAIGNRISDSLIKIVQKIDDKANELCHCRGDVCGSATAAKASVGAKGIPTL